MSKNVAANGGFFCLPLELRQEIYLQYLITTYRPTPWMVYRHTRTDSSPPTSPFGSVSKQFRQELRDVLRQQTDFCYRISSQEATFDGHALSCFGLLGKTLSYNEIQHLTVEIYPPHPDRPIDMVRIWRRVQQFCEDLQATSVIPSLTIHFMEDDIAGWSTIGQAHNAMQVMPWINQTTNCDVSFILDVFARLTNVTVSVIRIPASLKDWKDLQDFAQGVQHSMTNLYPFYQKSVQVNYELLVDEIEDVECPLKLTTGRKSMAKLEAFYGENARLTHETVKKFQEIWPHLDELKDNWPDCPARLLHWGHMFNTDNEWEAESRHGKPSWI